MDAIGLKYIGRRAEGIMLMLYRSYKSVRINKQHPYRFTKKDRTDQEACNYYNRLKNLGVDIIYQDNDFKIDPKAVAEVKDEPLAAELDVQIDTTQKANPVEETEAKPVSEEISESNLEVTSEVIHNPGNADKPEFKSMSESEIAEYLEMNYNKDQLKTVINDLGLDIQIGRKSASTLVENIISSADINALVDYLSK